MATVEQPRADVVLRYLMGVSLADHEIHFRALIDNVAEAPDRPKIRDLTIATTGLLMQLGRVDWPIVLKVITHLSKVDDEVLTNSAICLVNGDYLLLPTTLESFITLDLKTLRESTRPAPPAFVSTVYGLGEIWGEAVRILKDA